MYCNLKGGRLRVTRITLDSLGLNCIHQSDSQNSLQDKEEYEEKQKNLQQVCSPIMAKLHGQQQQQQPHPYSSSDGLTVEEMD